MAGETEKVDIFVLDNNPSCLAYVALLRANKHAVEVVTDDSKRSRLCEVKTKVFVLADILNGLFSGVETAKTIRSWPDGSEVYIHVVCTDAQQPSLETAVADHIINSYSTRDPDKFQPYLPRIEEALK